MHHIYLKVKSVALYALPICVLVLLSFGVSISTVEASEISSLDIVVVETSLMTVSMEQVASNTQLVDQSSWDSFWNWDWIWNWFSGPSMPASETTEPAPEPFKPVRMHSFAWSG